MSVVFLVAGAGGMYCGSCLRDNRLVAALLRQRRDVVLIPLYTPIRTDEADVSRRTVYFGGLNVYLQHRWRIFRHTPRLIQRLLDSPFLLGALGGLASNTSAAALGPLTVSVLRGAHGDQQPAVEKLIDGLRALNPSLIHLPNLMFVGIVGALKTEWNVPVVCNLSGEDLFLDALPEQLREEAHRLIAAGAEQVDGFMAPSRYYADYAARRFGLRRDLIHYVPMGVSLDGIGPPKKLAETPFVIGYLARICPEKGLDQLCDAFALLRAHRADCRLRIAGYLAKTDRPYLKRTMKKLRARGFGAAVDFVGEVDHADKLEFLQSLHVLSVPTAYHESKGLYVLEALACGVPVVQPRHGSFPELIEATGGGRLFEPGDTQGLADALAELRDNPALRATLGEAGRNAVRNSFTDGIMAEATWDVFERFGIPEDGAHNERGDRRTM